MSVYLLENGVTKNSATEAALRASIPDIIGITSLEAALKPKASIHNGGMPIVIITLPPGEREQFDGLVETFGRHGDNGLFFILIGDELSASDYKRLLRTGCADWTSLNASPDEVIEMISRRRASENGRHSARRGGSPPVTVSFIPSAGGVGNATIIVEIAALIKTDNTMHDRKVCLVDLDFQTGHLCDYLDCEPRLQIAELSNAPERLDEHLFDSFKTRHSSGIDIFAASRSKYASEHLNIHALDALFSMIAMRYDLLLIDYPVTWFQWTPQIIAASDAVIVTGINTIPSLRQVSETLAFVRSCGSKHVEIGVVINRCERALLGAISRRKHVETVLQNERLFLIATRSEATESINMGVPMTLGSSVAKARKEFGALASFCATLQSHRRAYAL
jgi:pilus assembly protein CpaE